MGTPAKNKDSSPSAVAPVARCPRPSYFTYFTTMSSSSAAGSGATTFANVVTKFTHEYTHNTPKRLKIIDAYLTYVFLTGVGSFILGVCLRLQVNPQNKSHFEGISPERGFADFIFAHIILHLVVMNFIG